MATKLDQVVPFGRSLWEYELIFSLTEEDLTKRILSCADGPASFNAELKQQGVTVTSVDPLYQFSGPEIAQRFEDCYEQVFSQIRNTVDDFSWIYHRDPDDLLKNRRRALQSFVQDYEQGRKEARYIIASLPDLPFPDISFDLALCSHFLFLYTDHFTLEFHLRSIEEMLRVAGEVRIFPLLTLSGDYSPYLGAVSDHLCKQGYIVIIEPVAYELQKGGNEMMRIVKAGV
ncbi:MAG: class I SAM-dependent methyltransferase [Gammaproteobacteria bacterium]|nr:class I SAM-dependent methyltransferase [Gammaproteobacteria bacterium]